MLPEFFGDVFVFGRFILLRTFGVVLRRCIYCFPSSMWTSRRSEQLRLGRGHWNSRSRSRSPAGSIRVECSDDEPAAPVRVELVAADLTVCRFVVDPDASIGQVSAKFKLAAFNVFNSNEFWEAHKNSTISLISPGSSDTSYELSRPYAKLLHKKVVRDIVRANLDAPLCFRLDGSCDSLQSAVAGHTTSNCC